MLFFFLKLFALVIVWECAYYFILAPARIPDKFLTDVITSAVTGCINFFSHAVNKYSWQAVPGADFIMQNGRNVFMIADACNGLSLMVIYVGLIVLLPYPLKRKIVFSTGGIIVLIIANITRCVLLYWIYKKHPDMFELNHHYLFTILMYLLIFYGWLLFTKKGKVHAIS